MKTILQIPLMRHDASKRTSASNRAPRFALDLMRIFSFLADCAHSHRLAIHYFQKPCAGSPLLIYFYVDNNFCMKHISLGSMMCRGAGGGAHSRTDDEAGALALALDSVTRGGTHGPWLHQFLDSALALLASQHHDVNALTGCKVQQCRVHRLALFPRPRILSISRGLQTMSNEALQHDMQVRILSLTCC